METPLATLEHGKCKAEIYENELPGSFTVRYLGPNGEVLAEEPLTGVSTYRQREREILERLADVAHKKGNDSGQLAASGEY